MSITISAFLRFFCRLRCFSVTMFNYANLHDVFPSGLPNPYDRKLQHEIESSRKSFDGILFIDRVLRAVGITKGALHFLEEIGTGR